MKQAKPLTYNDLPDGLCEEAIIRQRSEHIFTYLTKPLIDGLARMFAGKNVLEVYSGRGHMSALLQERGVSVKSTSLRQGHDGSFDLGHVFDVEDIDAASAVDKYRNWMDFLLVCWPTTNMGMFHTLKALPKHVPIVFIGEITDYSASPPFLGGCASDEFFENVHENVELSDQIDYQCFGHAKLKVFNRSPKIELRQENGYSPF